MDSHILRFPESENHTFSGWFVCIFDREQQLEFEILMSSHILRFPESKNHTFNGLTVSVSICFQHNLKINDNRNSKFNIVHLYHM